MVSAVSAPSRPLRPRRPGGLPLAAIALVQLFASPLRAGSAFEMAPPASSSLPEPQPVDIVKGVAVFASPLPSPSPKVTRPEPGSGKIEVRGYSTTTPDTPFNPALVYRATALPKGNDNPATDGHHRTLVGFYAIKPYQGSTAPRRVRFEIRLEAPGAPPQDSVIEMYSPADGKIRSIPAHISLPINRMTRPGRYKMSWSVIDQGSGDWDTASASFSKANVEKVAEVDPRSLPTPPLVARPPASAGFATTPPPRRATPGGEDFVTRPPAPKGGDDDSRFVTKPQSPKSQSAPGSSHQGFRTKADDGAPARRDGFNRSNPTPKKK